MKNKLPIKILGIVILVATALSAAMISGCVKNDVESTEQSNTQPSKQHGDYVDPFATPDYYGCPYSKRIKKLNLLKKKEA